jgi:hypothetical protein
VFSVGICHKEVARIALTSGQDVAPRCHLCVWTSVTYVSVLYRVVRAGALSAYFNTRCAIIRSAANNPSPAREAK